MVTAVSGKTREIHLSMMISDDVEMMEPQDVMCLIEEAVRSFSESGELTGEINPEGPHHIEGGWSGRYAISDATGDGTDVLCRDAAAYRERGGVISR
jgi:hypothetical protein